MAWKLSGNKLPVFHSWQQNALMLRTIVLSMPELQTIEETDIEKFEAMRAFNRGTLTEEEALARIRALPARDTNWNKVLHEPLEFHGWTVDCTLLDWRGSAWWVAHVTKSGVRVTDGDRRWLHRVLDVIGCDPAADLISVTGLDSCVEHRIPCLYAWPNVFERSEIQFGKNGMRIVPKGTRPSDGFERMKDPSATSE